MKVIWSLLSDQRGLTAVEYSLLLAFIGALVVIAVAAVAAAVTGTMDTMTDNLTE